ncbi:hypothetical protein AB1Y20_014439 [Prymnesium parvum]
MATPALMLRRSTSRILSFPSHLAHHQRAPPLIRLAAPHPASLTRLSSSLLTRRHPPPPRTSLLAARPLLAFPRGVSPASPARLMCSDSPAPDGRLKYFLPGLGNLAYLALASGFLMTDILTLRLLLVGGYSGLVMYHALQQRPLRIPLRWSAFFVAVNAYMAYKLLCDLFPGEFTEEEEAIYSMSFSQLSRGQFRRLMDAGEHLTLPVGTILTEERQPCDKLFFIVEGHVVLTLNGEFVTQITSGGFCNTLAMQQGTWKKNCQVSSSYGTITSRTPLRVVVWPLSTLRQIVTSDPALERRLNHALVNSLMRRLLHSRDGKHVQDYLGEKPRLKPTLTNDENLAVVPKAAELCEAAADGDVPKLRQYIKQGADVNEGDHDHRRCIHLAASERRLHTIKFLIEEAGADGNVRDRWGGTPLDDAERRHHNTVAAYLQSKGCVGGEELRAKEQKESEVISVSS